MHVDMGSNTCYAALSHLGSHFPTTTSCKSIVALTEADKSKKLSSSVIGVSLKSEASLIFVV